jgi:hypothetical protein
LIPFILPRNLNHLQPKLTASKNPVIVNVVTLAASVAIASVDAGGTVTADTYDDATKTRRQIEPCGNEFWQSVGIGIGFLLKCSNVGFRSGSGSVSGLKKVIGFFFSFFLVFRFFEITIYSIDVKYDFIAQKLA